MNRNTFERDLTTIYKLNDDIFDSRARLLSLINNNHKRNAKLDKKCTLYIESLRLRLNRLTLMRHDELMRLYSNVQVKRTIQRLPAIKQKQAVRRTISNEKPLLKTVLSYPYSTPTSRELTKRNNRQKPTESPEIVSTNEVIYPEGTVDFSPLDLIARYRKSIGQSTNFRDNPLLTGEDSIETLMIGLDQFAKQHSCVLCFTNMDKVFDQSIFDAPCDVFDLNSIHLLISHVLITAHFEFELELDYEKEFARSTDTMRNFVYEFRNAIADVLACRMDYIRIFSIEKLPNQSGQCQIHFGLTTINQLETEQYVQQLLTGASVGFATYEILERVVPKQYECVWKPLQAYFQIESNDFDPQYNFDFRTPDLPKQLSRGNRGYYVPIGWYRFGINIKNKYGNDRTWISHINTRGEWSVAFLGTNPIVIDSNTKGGELLTNVTINDQMRLEAMKPSSDDHDEINRPGLYVTTHCTNGADRYSKPFHVPTCPEKSEQFQIVFQCRIEPDRYTIHKGFVKSGDIWRIVDAKAIRPYGILVRKKISDE